MLHVSKTKTWRHKQSNSLQRMSSHLCRPLTRTPSPKHFTSSTKSCTHTFFSYAVVSQSPFITLHSCFSPAQFVLLFPTFTHIFYTVIFVLYLSSDSTISLLCVSHFRPNNIFFCLFHCHHLRHGAPKSLRTGLLCRGLSPSPPDGYTTGLRCDEWLTFFRAECAEPSQLLSPRESSRFLWRLELVYSAHRQH